MITDTQTLETEVEVEYFCCDEYTIYAKCIVEYTIIDYAEEHPYGNSTATETYSEVDIISIDIDSWYRDFDCSDAMSVWIPEHLAEYEGKHLDRIDAKKIKRLASMEVERGII